MHARMWRSTMTSTLLATTSRASSPKRSELPAAERSSITMFLPSK